MCLLLKFWLQISSWSLSAWRNSVNFRVSDTIPADIFNWLIIATWYNRAVTLGSFDQTFIISARWMKSRRVFWMCTRGTISIFNALCHFFELQNKITRLLFRKDKLYRSIILLRKLRPCPWTFMSRFRVRYQTQFFMIWSFCLMIWRNYFYILILLSNNLLSKFTEVRIVFMIIGLRFVVVIRNDCVELLLERLFYLRYFNMFQFTSSFCKSLFFVIFLVYFCQKVHSSLYCVNFPQGLRCFDLDFKWIANWVHWFKHFS